MAQILIWIFVILMPSVITALISSDLAQGFLVLRSTLQIMIPVLILYLVNYLWLVPHFLFVPGKKKWFYLINGLILLAINFRSIFPGPIPEEVQTQLTETLPFPAENLWAWYAGLVFVAFIVQCVFILLAVGVRQIQRNHELKLHIEEEKRKETEAELNWLKHQLNPHFLFNTLNNISSLTQIDPDKAQESIGQLSDLLRYALYESNADFVSLSGEVSFMQDYISLMQLRCNEKTTVEQDFRLPSQEVKVAPLLFISLIENAFKHGVNARYPSFIRIQLMPDQKDLVFTCENSLFEKTGTDHIGSGIGLENLQRRLELVYPGAFDFTRATTNNTYSATVRLKNILS